MPSESFKKVRHRLGIIAGGGSLPREILRRCAESQHKPFVVGFDGQTDQETLQGTEHFVTRLGAAGKVIRALKDAQVTEIVMVGHIRRPGLWDLKPDMKALGFFTQIGLKAMGDDSLLRAVADVLQKEGFGILGVDDLVTDLLFPAGCLTKVKPDEQALADIAHGVKIAQTLGALDVGQAVIVQQGLVLAVEAIEGTDAMLNRAGALARSGKGGVLVKMKKPQQDRRLDLPTIGPNTVMQAAKAGLRGIAAHAGHVIILEQDQCVRLANQHKFFLYGVDDAENTLSPS